MSNETDEARGYFVVVAELLIIMVNHELILKHIKYHCIIYRNSKASA